MKEAKVRGLSELRAFGGERPRKRRKSPTKNGSPSNKSPRNRAPTNKSSKRKESRTPRKKRKNDAGDEE